MTTWLLAALAATLTLLGILATIRPTARRSRETGIVLITLAAAIILALTWLNA